MVCDISFGDAAQIDLHFRILQGNLVIIYLNFPVIHMADSLLQKIRIRQRICHFIGACLAV